MGKEEKKETIFVNGDAVQINNEILDNVIYAYYKKGMKDPVVSAQGKVIKDKYNVETHRDFINVYDGFEGGRMYIVKEMIDGEDDPIVYRQIAPTIRDNMQIPSNINPMNNNFTINDNVDTNQNLIIARNNKDYVEKITEISKLEIVNLKSLLDKANEMLKNYQDENTRLRQENFELKLKYENELWKNQFVREKESEIEKQTEKEIKKYQQTLGDSNTTAILSSLIDKVAPVLINKFLYPDQKQNIQTQQTIDIPNIPTINEKDVNINNEEYNGNTIS